MPEDAFSIAVAAFRAGALAEAEQHLLRLLLVNPKHTEALNLLGIVATRAGRYGQAVAAIGHALAIEPDNASLHCNLGECYRNGGRPDEAEPHYREALRLRPDYATARYNLGLALAAQGKLEEAADSYRRALEAKPDYLKALTNLGNVLKRLGNIEKALVHHRRAADLAGGHPDALYNLANTLAALHRPEDAEALYRRVLQRVPEHAGALNNLGNSLRERGRLQEALACHEQAVRRHPEDVTALINQAILLKELDRPQEAIPCLERAKSLSPEDPEVLCNLADLLHQEQRDAEALALWGQVLAADPGCLRAHEGLGGFYRKQEEMERAREHLDAPLNEQPDNLVLRLRLDSLCPTVFPDFGSMEAYRVGLRSKLDAYAERHWSLELEDIVRYGCDPSFNLPFHGRDDLPLKRRQAELLARHLPSELPLKTRAGMPHLGLVVTAGHEGIFQRDVVSNINRFSRGRLRMTVVCPAGSIAAMREQVSHPDVGFLPLARGLGQMLRDIRASGFDLLYYHEVGSDTINYILPFFRLAPVQCNTWGIQVTSGIPNLDCYLSSRWIEPDGAQAHYSERLVLLDSMLKQRTPARVTQDKSRADFGFSQDQSLYFCPQHLGKLHPDFDAAIGEILRLDPNGLVLLVEHPTAAAARHLRERLGRSIPDVAGRVRMLAHQNQQDYFSLIALSDVLLDPFHFVGVNTTCDALALGKAVVTLPGAFQRGRYTLGCYRKMGVMDCVAGSVAEYVRIAVRLATDSDFRSSIEQRIAERVPDLFEPDRIAGELERCLLDLIEASRG